MIEQELTERLEAGEDVHDLVRRKWRDIVDKVEQASQIINLIDIRHGSSNCAYCREYGCSEEDLMDREIGGLKVCPIMRHTGKQFCKDTPYKEFTDVMDIVRTVNGDSAV